MPAGTNLAACFTRHIHACTRPLVDSGTMRSDCRPGLHRSIRFPHPVTRHHRVFPAIAHVSIIGRGVAAEVFFGESLRILRRFSGAMCLVVNTKSDLPLGRGDCTSLQ